MEQRYEVKLPLRAASPSAVLAAVRSHCMGFTEAFPPRIVSSLYFDTPDLRCYHESHAGLGRRLKLRLRWYGDDPTLAAFEWKWREGQLGSKRTLPVDVHVPLAELDVRALRSDVRGRLSDVDRVAFDALRQPTVLTRYRRRYYESRDGQCRLTIDDELAFAADPGGMHPRRRPSTPALRLQVLELKLPSAERETLVRALQSFRYRPARYSKYCAALDCLAGVAS